MILKQEQVEEGVEESADKESNEIEEPEPNEAPENPLKEGLEPDEIYFERAPENPLVDTLEPDKLKLEDLPEKVVDRAFEAAEQVRDAALQEHATANPELESIELEGNPEKNIEQKQIEDLEAYAEKLGLEKATPDEINELITGISRE